MSPSLFSACENIALNLDTLPPPPPQIVREMTTRQSSEELGSGVHGVQGRAAIQTHSANRIPIEADVEARYFYKPRVQRALNVRE